MGLEMWAMTAPSEARIDQHKKLHEWGRHPDLHGWMQNLWNKKNGTNEPEFNASDYVALTKEDLDALEHAITHRLLPKSTGFFIGESDGSEMLGDLIFISKARLALKQGKFVYYTSWW